MTNGEGSIAADYPQGFDENNSIILSFMCHHSSTNSTYAYGYAENSAAYVAGAVGHYITLGTNNKINIHIYNQVMSGSGSGDFNFKMVIMKLPELNIANYEKGDVNMDGEITQSDADMALGYYTGNTSLTDKQFKLADMNNDGKITPADSTLIQQLL